jgi:hypothetical protein
LFLFNEVVGKKAGEFPSGEGHVNALFDFIIIQHLEHQPGFGPLRRIFDVFCQESVTFS